MSHFIVIIDPDGAKFKKQIAHSPNHPNQLEGVQGVLRIPPESERLALDSERMPDFDATAPQSLKDRVSEILD